MFKMHFIDQKLIFKITVSWFCVIENKVVYTMSIEKDYKSLLFK